MLTVVNTRNGKYAKAEKVDDNTYTLIFTDGTQKDVKADAFGRLYKESAATDYDAAKEAATPAPKAPKMTEEDKAAAAEAKKAVAEAKKAAQAEAKAKKDAEKAAAAEAKKLAAEIKKAELEAAKASNTDADKEAKAAEKAAEKAAKAAEKEAEKAAKAAEREAAKVAREAEKAAKAAEKASTPKKERVAGEAGAQNKRFFQNFLDAVNAQNPDLTKAKARDRSYMSFPAGASGFKYKFVFKGSELKCSLYIFGPQVVTNALFNELEKYKEAIDAAFAEKGLTLDWSAPDDLKVRRVLVTLTGTEDQLIDEGVQTLVRFNQVITPYIDKITA